MNTIQLKRGSGVPGDGVLAPYELGYDKDGKQLYIGEPKNEEDFSEGTTSKLIEQYISLPKIILTKPPKRTKRIKKRTTDGAVSYFRPAELEVNCYNLVPGRKYTIKLYTKQRYQGHSSREWRHPENAITQKGRYTGYANLAEETLNNYRFPVIQNWMLNGGLLKTEWSFTCPSDKNNYTLVLNLSEWVLDLLKPATEEQDPDSWVLIGVQKNKNYRSSRLFKFYLEDEYGLIGQTDSILRIGDIEYIPSSEYQLEQKVAIEEGNSTTQETTYENGYWANIGYVSVIN